VKGKVGLSLKGTGRGGNTYRAHITHHAVQDEKREKFSQNQKQLL
jgi:hypothetical protein